jgi:hypothetical protein
VKLDYMVTKEMLAEYFELNSKKKEIEKELDKYKSVFNQYFDYAVGQYAKGEVTIGSFKLERQIRKTEKFDDDSTVKRLEELRLSDLVQTVKKPDEEKIHSALNLGLISDQDLEGCRIIQSSRAIYVKNLT